MNNNYCRQKVFGYLCHFNSHDPKGKFSFYAFIINNNYCISLAIFVVSNRDPKGEFSFYAFIINNRVLLYLYCRLLPEGSVHTGSCWPTHPPRDKDFNLVVLPLDQRRHLAENVVGFLHYPTRPQTHWKEGSAHHDASWTGSVIIRQHKPCYWF